MNTKIKKEIFFFRQDFVLFKNLILQELKTAQADLQKMSGTAKTATEDYTDRLSKIIQKLEDVEQGAGVRLNKKY